MTVGYRDLSKHRGNAWLGLGGSESGPRVRLPVKTFCPALLADVGTALPGSPQTHAPDSENHLVGSGEEDNALKLLSFLVILHLNLAQLFLFLLLFCAFEFSIVTVSADVKLVSLTWKGNPEGGAVILPEIPLRRNHITGQ